MHCANDMLFMIILVQPKYQPISERDKKINFYTGIVTGMDPGLHQIAIGKVAQVGPSRAGCALVGLQCIQL